METLHLRAEHNVIEKLMSILGDFSKQGNEIEILDNVSFNIEHSMIMKGIGQERDAQLVSHEDLWNELLNK